MGGGRVLNRWKGLLAFLSHFTRFKMALSHHTTVTPCASLALRPVEDRRGAWCIGPAIGAIEIYAKCFTVEEVLRKGVVFGDPVDVKLQDVDTR